MVVRRAFGKAMQKTGRKIGMGGAALEKKGLSLTERAILKKEELARGGKMEGSIGELSKIISALEKKGIVPAEILANKTLFEKNFSSTVETVFNKLQLPPQAAKSPEFMHSLMGSLFASLKQAGPEATVQVLNNKAEFSGVIEQITVALIKQAQGGTGK